MVLHFKGISLVYEHCGQREVSWYSYVRVTSNNLTSNIQDWEGPLLWGSMKSSVLSSGYTGQEVHGPNGHALLSPYLSYRPHSSRHPSLWNFLPIVRPGWPDLSSQGWATLLVCVLLGTSMRTELGHVHSLECPHV